MKRLSPLVQMTMALVALATTLLILGSTFFDAVPDRDSQERVVRKAVAEALAVQLADMLRRDDPRQVERTLAEIATRTQGLRSIGVRRADGTLAVQSGTHEKHWRADSDERSAPEQINIPLNANGERWGRVEFAFARDDTNVIVAFFKQPLVQLLLFMTAAGWLVFGLYMRRALQHLDPSSVVPERVQGAFDAMGEGIVVLDARGQIMMTNKAFRAMDPSLEKIPTGTRLAALPWLAPALHPDTATHPWSRAMSERTAKSGASLEVGEGGQRHLLVVNAAPISDAGGSVRGCMVTVSDMTALHRANEALRDAMEELAGSKKEVDAKNAELERLATRDPLTGALNRRAFQNAYDALASQARLTNQKLACLMIDIDHFKKINDTHGHGIGDRVIQEVARKLQDSVRGTDLVCRWGGEEFCVVLSGLDRTGTAEFAERVRQRIEREVGAAVREVDGLRVTGSLGVSFLNDEDEDLTSLVGRADQALYQAKHAGRNRVMLPTSPQDATTARRLSRSSRSADGASAPNESSMIDPESGCLNADGWSAAQRRLIKSARADDRVLGCLMISLDDMTMLQAAHGEPMVQLLVATLARLTQESSPPAAAVARPDARSIAVMVPGFGVEDCQQLAKQIRRRVKHELASVIEGAASGSLSISVGIDALPARSNGAATLGERAEQAMARVRRAGGNDIAEFAPPRSEARTTPRSSPLRH